MSMAFEKAYLGPHVSCCVILFPAVMTDLFEGEELADVRKHWCGVPIVRHNTSGEAEVHVTDFFRDLQKNRTLLPPPSVSDLFADPEAEVLAVAADGDEVEAVLKLANEGLDGGVGHGA
jgi:hypothetical protein